MPASISTVCVGVRTSERPHAERDAVAVVGRRPPLPQRLRHDAEHRAAVERERAVESARSARRHRASSRLPSSSTSSPCVLAGWMNAMREPCAPARGRSSMSRTPRAFRSASAASMSGTRRHSGAAPARASRETSPPGPPVRWARPARSSCRRSRRSAADAGRRPRGRPSAVRTARETSRRPPARRRRRPRGDRVRDRPGGAERSPQDVFRRAVGIDLTRRNPIEDLRELAGREHVHVSRCCMNAAAEDFAQPPLGARPTPRAQRLGRLGAEAIDHRHQLSDAAAGRRHGAHDRRPPLPLRPVLERQHRLDRRGRAIGALAIGLVDDEDVGDLHDAGLEGLHLVAGARHDGHDRHVRRPDDVHLVLADADGLDQHDVEARGVEHRRGFSGRPREPAEVPARRHAADEDALVLGVRLHAHAVAEHGPAAVRAGRIDREHAHRATARAQLGRDADRRACSCRRRAGR